MPRCEESWKDWPERRAFVPLLACGCRRFAQIGSYHYVSGVDASSSASLAAYINSLTYTLEDNSTWFAKGNAWKVRSGCYWSVHTMLPSMRINHRLQLLQRILAGRCARRRQNSRRRARQGHRPARGAVRVKPSARSARVTRRRHECTAEIWQETYLSALLRAILYADDPNYRLVGFRKLDPITTREGEIRFLQAAEALFFKGTCPVHR